MRPEDADRDRLEELAEGLTGLARRLLMFPEPSPVRAFPPSRFFCKGERGNRALQYSERQGNRDIPADSRVPKPKSQEYPDSHAGCVARVPDKFHLEAKIRRGRRQSSLSPASTSPPLHPSPRSS